MTRKQTEKDIHHLDGVDAIRAKPGMYIGHPDSYAVWTIFRELADNAVDEFLADRNDTCHLIYDGILFWCIDNGDGVPVGNIKVKTHGHTLTLPAVVAIYGMTHTGGKLGGGTAYEASRGTHGTGATATNAMSKSFKVYTKREGKWWYCAFEKGHLTVELVVSKAPKLPFGVETPKRGTVICFTPDYPLFDKGSKLQPQHIADWCRITSYLNGGLTIRFTNPKGSTKEWYSEKGAEDYLAVLLEESEATALGDFVLHSDKQLDLALAFTDYDGVGVKAFTNGLANVDGGVHSQALFKAVTDVLLTYKARGQTFVGSDLREGMFGILNYKIASPAFSSQTKEKLIDERVKEPCYSTIYGIVAKFFKSNKALATTICERTEQLRTLKNEWTSNKKVLKALATNSRSAKLPPKLVPSTTNKPMERELYLVEGDSAGGSGSRARDKTYQEMLPLKGKLLNVYKAKSESVFASEEVLNILRSIGYDPSKADPIAGLRVGKVVLLGDADVDGGHVNTLNLCLLAKYLPEMFKRGMVYVAKGAEYVVEADDRNYYADSPDAMRKQLPNASLMKRLLHLKGWAELSAKGLSELAFNPKTRTLTRIDMPSKKDMSKFEALMGEDVSYRKEWLGI